MYVAWVRLGGQQISHQICRQLLNVIYLVISYYLVTKNPNILGLKKIVFCIFTPNSSFKKIVKPIKLSESGFILILIIIHILKVYLSKTKNNSLINIMLYVHVYTCSIKGIRRLGQKLETMECLFNKL